MSADRPPRLTDAEWEALSTAIVSRDLDLETEAFDHGTPVGRERAALARARDKVRDHLRPRPRGAR